MNFGVIGEPCIDFIHKESKLAEKKLGGILYAITSLAVISGSEHYVYPIMYLGEDEHDYIISFLANFNNIKFDFIKKVKQKVRVVQLYYHAHREDHECHSSGNTKTYDREETSTYPIEPVEYEHVKLALKNIDALLINMISGIDITLDTLKKIRNDFEGYIHMDAHNIVMTTYPDGRRLQGPIDDWFDWCTNCNTLQMNETELNIMTPLQLSEEEIADEILINDANKTNALAVTRGKEGVSLYIPNASAPLSIEKFDIRAIENDRFKDSTGCGDVFGAGFFYKNALSTQRDYLGSMKFGNRLASAKSELVGVEEMMYLSPLLKGKDKGVN